MKPPEDIPSICKACQHDPDFWEAGEEWMFAFVEFGVTTSGFVGTKHQIESMNRYLAHQGSESYFVDIADSPPLRMEPRDHRGSA